MGKRVTQKSRDEFAVLLKGWRERLGITQKVAGEKLKVPLKSIQNWEGAWTSPQGPLRAMLEAKINRP